MSSRSKVTITLGRRGQVVKSGSTAQVKTSGAKRPITERLGANLHHPSFSGGRSTNKRQRMDRNESGLIGGIISDQQIGGGDLRLKLIQKGVTKNSRTVNGEVDLREKLLRKLPKKHASNYPLNHAMERESERLKQREREIVKQIERQGKREIDLSARRVAATQSADNLPPYPSWSYDTQGELHPNHRGGCSLNPPAPPPLNRPFVDLRPLGTAATVCSRPCSGQSSLKRGNDLVGRSMVASEYVTNGVSTETRKGILPSLPPQRQPNLPETVDELLTNLELDKYKIIFKVEEVDMGALKQMGDSDLKELGIPMGPRKKILLAIRSSAKQRPH